jgi:DNA-binding NtrC family response regulator
MSSKNLKIAIVDDENEILNMMKRYFEKNDKYTVTTFSNPVTAVASIDKSYDVVFLDIMMPQMNGLDALAKLTAKHPKLNVIMMTAYSTLDKVLSSHKKGATHYILKPFSSLKDVENKMLEVIK